MRKIWKCSPFFWKIFNFFQLHENRASLSSSGILPKNLKTVPLFVFFWEKFTTTPTISPTWNCFLDILSSKAIRRKVACIPPLPRLFPKHPPVALLLLEKIQKIFSTPLIIKITPLFCNTLFELFSKIFIPTPVAIARIPRFVSPCFALFPKKLPTSTLDYRKNISKALHPVWIFWKIFPNGKKKPATSAAALKSSRTVTFSTAEQREISIYYCYWAG